MNSILWGDTSNKQLATHEVSASATVTYNLHLVCGDSPCIGTGSGGINMGAYSSCEAQP